MWKLSNILKTWCVKDKPQRQQKYFEMSGNKTKTQAAKTVLICKCIALKCLHYSQISNLTLHFRELEKRIAN